MTALVFKSMHGAVTCIHLQHGGSGFSCDVFVYVSICIANGQSIL